MRSYKTPPQTPLVVQRIEQEGRAAALRYTDVNDACPYPFHSPEGVIFKRAFLAEHERQAQSLIEAAGMATAGAAA